jgi:hypothetical protein
VSLPIPSWTNALAVTLEKLPRNGFERARYSGLRLGLLFPSFFQRVAALGNFAHALFCFLPKSMLMRLLWPAARYCTQ